MKRSIAIAATLVAGAGATTVGATNGIPTQYFGSDTLFIVTQDVIIDTPTLGPSFEPNYLAGGSGAGQSAMAMATKPAEVQQTAPMAKMLTNGVCNNLGGTNGNTATNASGIVIGMNAVDLLSSSVTGGAASCNGATDNASADVTGFGAAYSGTTGIFTGSNAGPNWKWVLALLYGGLDLSPGAPASPDCNSLARQHLVSSWSNLFEKGCANASSACTDSTHKMGGANPVLWHAFRRDHASDTSDVFAALIGLQTWLGGSPSGSSNNGFGLSPYCNAMNWDANVETNGDGTAVTCANIAGPDDQFVGPGGLIDPASACTFTDFKPADLGMFETCGAPGSGNHRMPPARAYGTAPDPNLGGAANGLPAWDVLPTGFQDNDPIRRPCLGTATGSPFASSEEVCNTDGKLGVVLAIPSSDFILALKVFSTSLFPTAALQYPSNACTGTYFEGDAPKIISCAPASSAGHAGQCPNGDALFASNKCSVPVDDSNRSAITPQCLNGKSPVAPIKVRASTVGSDARVHNLAMYVPRFENGVATESPTFISEIIQNGSTPPPGLDFMGGMGRIHTVGTIFDTTLNGGNPTNVGCELMDATDQINCLVQADPCSVGYASNGGKSFTERENGACDFLTTANGGNLCATSGGTTSNPGFTNGSGGPCPAACLAAGTLTAAPVIESVRIDQVYPNAAAVLALGQQTHEYPVGHKLYFNSLIGFDAIADTTNDPAATGELALAEFEGVEANIAPILEEPQRRLLPARRVESHDGYGPGRRALQHVQCALLRGLRRADRVQPGHHGQHASDQRQRVRR